jgi:RNA polymerase sigma-70 factor (ECF subfamily)
MTPARTAIEELYRTYGATVLRRAQVILGAPSVAEDVMQEVFVRLLRSPQGVLDAASPLAWIYQVTTRLCFDQLRRNKSRRAWEDTVQPAYVSWETPCDAMLVVRRLLERMDGAEATAAVYIYVDQMTYEEAAALLGVSKRTVGNLVHRFATRARSLLDEGVPRLASKTAPEVPQ